MVCFFHKYFFGLIRQAKACLFSLRHNLEALTVFIFVLNFIIFAIYFSFIIPQMSNNIKPIDYVFPEWVMVFDDYYKHFFDGSAAMYFVLSTQCYNWRTGKYALYSLWMLWVFGLMQYLFQFQIDIYYIGIVCCIFLIFVYNFTKHVLINR